MKHAGYLSALFFFISAYSAAQSNFSFADYGTDSAKFVVGTMGKYTMNSTALTNRFYNLALKGKYIDKPAKDRVSKRLVKFNKAGMDYEYGLFYTQKIDSVLGKTGFNYFISAADKAHSDALFTDDLFKVVFYGNKGYEGDTARLGSFNFNVLRYQQLQLGLIKKNENETEFGIGLSILKGEQFYEINAYRANVFTSANGKDIDVDLLYSAIRSDTANKGWGAVNGLGASAGLYYQVPYYMFRSPDDTAGGGADWKGFVRIEASDLGFIKWNGNSQKSIIDTTLHFEGVVIENFLEWSDSIGKIAVDSLKNIVEPSWQNSSFTNVIPGYFHLKMYQENSAGLYLSMGTLLRIFSNYSPLIYIQGGHYIKNKYRLGGTVEFGGYGKFNFGIEASALLKGFALTLGTYNFADLFFPNYFGGSSLYGGIKKSF